MGNGLDGSSSTEGEAISAKVRVRRESMGVGVADTPVVTLVNAHGIEMQIMGYGGIIRSLKTPDRFGTLADITLGYQTAAEYRHDQAYFGALIGRNANRIANAEFVLDGQRVSLTRNDGNNHLHGGTQGFNAHEWHVEPFDHNDECGAVLTLATEAGNQGYPGTLRARVRYALNSANELTVNYGAETDAETPVNLTQHSYFNLSGEPGSDILDHDLQINADCFLPVDSALIPTGEFQSVAGTPFDFTSPRRIGQFIGAPDEQLRLGGGYDHNFVLNQSSASRNFAARLHHARSGRIVEIFSTEPGMQFYSGNLTQNARPGKNGTFPKYAGVALETQHFPDSPNHPQFPSTILQPGGVYQSETVYRFSVEG